MNKVIAFVVGAAAGSLLTWKLLEKKYKQMADEEIAAVKEYFRNKEDETKEELIERFVEEDKLDGTRTEYTKMVNDMGYTSVSRSTEYSVEEDGSVYMAPGPEEVAPYVISPDEYGSGDYEVKCWTCYADSVITDDEDEIVWNPESIIGDALNHFGDYEDDSVHVRNENTGCDYEILKNEHTFSEVNGVNN